MAIDIESSSVKIIAPLDLTSDEVGVVREAFALEGISAEIDCLTFVKSAEQAIANFILDFAKEARLHGMDRVLDFLVGVGTHKIAKAFEAIRKRIPDREVNVTFHLGSPHRLSYIVPDPPADEKAIKAIKAHYESMIDAGRTGDVFWFEDAWITSSEYLERFD